MEWFRQWIILGVFAALELAPELAHAQTIVPFTLEGGHLIVVEGSIGRAENLKLVVDTGASSTVIAPRLAKTLGLKGRSRQTAAFDRQIEVSEVVLPSVTIGPLRFEAAPARIGPLDYGDLLEPVEIDALIGLDLLRVAAKPGLVIDYANRSLTFGVVAHTGAPVPFYNKFPFIPVTLSVQGKNLNLLLDTGYGELLLFARAVEARIPFRRTPEVVEMRSAGGRRALEKVLLSKVRLGETEWEVIPAYLLDSAAPISRLDGVLGARSLGLKRLCIDFEKGLMSWQQ